MNENNGATFLTRHMKMKLSLYRCRYCEDRAKTGQAVPYLFHKVNRGKRCPNCNGAAISKISISAVMDLRWNRVVKQQLDKLRLAPTESLRQNA